jgi:hypothetical protein
MKASRASVGPSALFAAGFALCALGVLTPSSAQAAPAKTGVVAGSGTSSSGQFTAGPDGAEYQLPSLARLSLSPGTVVRVFPNHQDLQLAPGSKTTTYSLALLRGRVDVTVPAKPKTAVLCSIGKVSVVVGAGQATLLTRGDESTVAALEGDVRTFAAERWQVLAPGSLAHVSGDHVGAAQPIAAAPSLAQGQRVWFSPGEPVAVGGFTFGKVDGADHYELRLRALDGSGAQLRTVRGSTRLEQPFMPVAPGQYELTGRSIDAEGIAGRWSKSEAVRVVGISLPPGGYASGGDIFIGEGQEVHFSHADGLEMTYGGAGGYVPASQAVSLYRGEATLISFRVPGSTLPTTARLRPRGLYAHVALGPSRAVWPTDPVQIAVEVRSQIGEAIPAWLELKPEVKLGIEPIEVAFTRDGNRLIGTVPPTDRPGPWVLRVEVKDQFGALLGRDFLEIAKAPPRPPKPLSKPVTARVASK